MNEIIVHARDHESLYSALLSVSIAMVVVSCTVTGLRLYTRTFILHFVGLDDWTIAVAQVLAILVTAFTCVEARHGLGQHVWVVAPERRIVHLKFLYCVVLTYNVSMNIVKTSFLLLYRRLFPTKTITRVCKYGMILVPIWTVVSALLLSFSCVPLSIVVPRWTNRCLDTLPIWYTCTITATVLDFVIFVIPLPAVARLRVPLRQKVMIVGIFCLGFFVCIVSVIRALTLHRAAESDDPTWDNVGAAYWTVVELNCAILASSLPALRPLLARFLPKLAILSTHQTHQELRERTHATWHGRILNGNVLRKLAFQREHVTESLKALGDPEKNVQPERESFEWDLTRPRHYTDTICFGTKHDSHVNSPVPGAILQQEMIIASETVITIAKQYV